MTRLKTEDIDFLFETPMHEEDSGVKKGVPAASPWADDEILDLVAQYKKYVARGAEAEEAYDFLLTGGDDA